MDLVAAHTGNWKLIRTPALERFELYDLADDPAERQNRYRMTPAGQAMTELLASWQASVPPAPRTTDQDRGLGEKLRALGYVQ